MAVRYFLAVVASVFGIAFAADPPVKSKVTFRPDFKDKPLKEVVEEIESKSGLMFISKRGPSGTVTLKTDRDLTETEYFDRLNEVLEPKEFILWPKEVSFSVVAVEDLDPARQTEKLPIISASELDGKIKLEWVRCFIELAPGADEDEVHQTAKKLLSKGGEVTAFGKDGLLVSDTVANVHAIRAKLPVQQEKKK